MAINPETQYPGKITPSTPDYPYGAARNITLPGDGTGTPWESALVNDLFGFQQALLGEGAIVPSGTPDKVGASQYLEAMRFLFGRVVGGKTAAKGVDPAKYQKLCIASKDGGFFRAVTGATPGTYSDDSAASAGTVIIPTGGDGSKAFIRVIQDATYSLEWFGGEADATTINDTAFDEILAALDGVGGKIVGNEGGYRVTKSIGLPSNVTLSVHIVVDGDTFTAQTSPVAIVHNKTFSTFASADRRVFVLGSKIELKNNTAALNPKMIMFGGVIGGAASDNEITMNGDKASAAIECFKSTKDIWIERNEIDVQTGNVTGGAIWLANRTTTDLSSDIHVNDNVVSQDSIDEILAVFPVAGPMARIRINGNTLTRLNAGATDGPIMRVFCADGLGGGAPTATLTDVKGDNNTLVQLRTNNIVSGVMQIGNASIDANDPTDVSFTRTTIKGYFPSTTIALRFDFNAEAQDVEFTGTVVDNEGAFDASNQGITDPVGGVKIRGGSVKNFGTNVNGHDIEGVESIEGSIGIKALGRAVGNNCHGQLSVPMRVVARGAGVSQLVQGNILKPTATKRCLQLDATADVIENLRLLGNDFDGSAGTVTAIAKVGGNTIKHTQTSGNDFSTCATLWGNTLGMLLGRNTYDPAIVNPVGNIQADPGSEFWNPAGGAGTTLYVKEANTGDTGWVGK